MRVNEFQGCCPICQLAAVTRKLPYRDVQQTECLKCGQFQLSRTAATVLVERLKDEGPMVVAMVSHAMQQFQGFQESTLILSDKIDALINAKLPSADNQIANLLRWISEEVGDDFLAPIENPNYDRLASIVGARDGERMRNLINHAVKEGLIEWVRDTCFALTLEGGRSMIAMSPPKVLTVADLLAERKTSRIEFKSTACKPLDSKVPEKVIHGEIIKTVAAFMNTEGGTLGVGISDDGDLLGVQPDLNFKRQDLGGYEGWLSTLLINAVGGSNVASLVKIRSEKVGDKTICLIDVLPALKEVYANTSKGKETFYVRVGNSTQMMTGPEMVDYIDDRYKK